MSDQKEAQLYMFKDSELHSSIKLQRLAKNLIKVFLEKGWIYFVTSNDANDDDYLATRPAPF